MSIVPPAASTAAIASASRIEPPGWTNAVTPAAEADLDRVREREERVRGARGARRRVRAEHGVRLGDRLAGRVDARGLAAAQPDQPAVADEHDRVRGHAADEPPGEVEVELLGVGRRAAGRAGPGGRVVGGDVGRRDEDRAAGGPDRAGRVGRGGAVARRRRAPRRRRRAGSAWSPGSRARRRRRPARRRSRGRSRRAASATARVDGPGQRDDPAERADRVGLERGLPGLDERRPFGGAARVGVLDDDARRGRAAPDRAPPRRRRRGRCCRTAPCPGAAARATPNGPSASVDPGRR